MKGRVRRWLAGLLAALVIVGAGVTGAAWHLLAGSLPQVDGTVRTAGVDAPVTIDRDALGTTTLSGASRRDLDFALGYVHAQQRYFAMDLARRVAAGELAALVGPAALAVDREHRIHRLRAVTTAAYAALPAADRAQLDHYRDGVNAGLAALRVRPWPYLLLRTAPAPWRSTDTLLVVAAMYLDLNRDGRNARELRVAEMRAALPGAVVDFLLAPDPHWEAALDGSRSPEPAIPAAGVIDLRTSHAAAPVRNLAEVLAPSHDRRLPGSNNFAVAGSRTASGAAMLANDMHLALRVPDIWFRTRLRYPDATAPGGTRDVIGMSLPGAPVMVVGSNGQLAWGFTNSYGDWADWVRVVRDPHDPARYRVPGGWESLTRHVETIEIKGAPAQRITVDDTRWGPIMAHDVDGTPLALAWIAQAPRSYNLKLGEMERAASVDAALALAPTFGMPPENLLVADSAGHIGWTIAGNGVPVRTGITSQTPADWSSPGTGWTGWLAPAHYPRISDPADGRLWTANNRTVGGAALGVLGNGGYDLGARARQIRDDLGTGNAWTERDLLAIQLDDRAVFLTRWHALLQRTLATTDDPALRELRTLSAHWSGRAAADSVDYRLVRAFREAVHDAVLAPFAARVGSRFPGFRWPPDDAEAAVWALITQQPANLLDPRYASWNALLVDAARHVVATLGHAPGGLAARTWGEVNRAGIRHPLSTALPAFIARRIDMPNDELPGDADMPRVARPGFGASERLVVTPGHEARGVLEAPGGSDANPLSPWHASGHADWVHGRPTPLQPGPVRHTLTLLPAPRAP